MRSIIELDMGYSSPQPLFIDSDSDAKRACNNEAGRGPGRNELVSLLSVSSRHRLLASCEKVPLRKGQVIYDRGTPLRYAYFIE